jgi:hypothetical protein
MRFGTWNVRSMYRTGSLRTVAEEVSKYESQKERGHWEDQDVGGWTILKWILERSDGMVVTGLNWLRIGTSGGLL